MQGLLPLLIRETDLEIAQAVLALNNDNKISDFQPSNRQETLEKTLSASFIV